MGVKFKTGKHKAVWALKPHSVSWDGSMNRRNPCVSRSQITAGMQGIKRLSKLGWAKPMTYNPANDLLFNRCQHRAFNTQDRCLKCLMGARSPASARWTCSWSVRKRLARQVQQQFNFLLPELWLPAQAVRDPAADLGEMLRFYVLK